MTFCCTRKSLVKKTNKIKQLFVVLGKALVKKNQIK